VNTAERTGNLLTESTPQRKRSGCLYDRIQLTKTSFCVVWSEVSIFRNPSSNTTSLLEAELAQNLQTALQKLFFVRLDSLTNPLGR